MKKTQAKTKQISSVTKKTTKKKTNGHMQGFKELFLNGLKDMYWVEKKLTKEIPGLMKLAGAEELKEAFQNHLEETEQQAKRLEEIFQMLGETPKATKCDAMEGILKEGKEHASESENSVRDATLIVSAQKVEHYEIASYGSLCTFSDLLGLKEVTEILKKSLKEEKEADRKLTDVAEETINFRASVEAVIIT